jgi:hypothetical protein
MSIIPDPREAQELRRLFADNHVIDIAENALRAFGHDIDAVTAAKLLPMWRYTSELSDRERRAVLARFVPEPEAGPLPYDRDDAHPQPGDPAPPLPDGVDGFPVTGRVVPEPAAALQVSIDDDAFDATCGPVPQPGWLNQVELGEGNSGPGGVL